jgi:glycine cleavage system T protein (aminomethyltransferase)
VRTDSGVFDVSHMGELEVEGPHAEELLQRTLSNDVSRVHQGEAQYTLLTNEDGGILDDLIVYAIDGDRALLVPNASNRDAVFERLRAAAPEGVDVAILDWSTLAVQGPRARDIVGSMYPVAKDLGYMRVGTDGDVVISRSGYTGEVGYEVFTTADAAVDAWRRLLEAVRNAGGQPCGLAARDTLRLEMGYPLHGNDIDPDTLPTEAGLEWAVKLEGREFSGARAIAETPPRKKLVGLRMKDKVIPRHGCRVTLEGRSIGTCTSGTFSPTLRVGIALAALEPQSVDVGGEVDVDVRGKTGRAVVVRPPFVGSSPK